MVEKNIIEITDDLIYVDSDTVEKLFYTTNDFETEKEKTRFIMTVEKTIRGSQEYRRFVKYVKEQLNLTTCTVLSSVSSAEVKLEMHHMPFTLFDLVEISLERRLSLGIPVSTFSLAEEVMVTHYQGIVGLVQVSATIHELIHAGKIFLGKDSVIGNVTGFFDIYSIYFNESQVIKYNAFLETGSAHTEVETLVDKKRELVDTENKKFINSVLKGDTVLQNKIGEEYND